jgi:hypothetical protein
MPTRTALAALVVVVLTTLTGPPLAAQASDLELPEGPGGWVLRVRTSGGVMGQGVGDMEIASDGRLICLGQKTRCRPVVAGEVMRAVLDQVRRASAATWLTLQPTTLCMDCVTTRLVLTSRNTDGTLTTLSASWDPTTRARLSGDVTRLHDMTLSLRR